MYTFQEYSSVPIIIMKSVKMQSHTLIFMKTTNNK